MSSGKKHVVGIDVSQDTFNACWEGADKAYENNRKGWRKLLEEAPGNSLFAMEATGNYHYRLAAFIHSNGCGVMVFNPFKVRSFANSGEGGKAKTDKTDARAVFRFALHSMDTHRLWEPLPPRHARARVIVSLLRGLAKLERAAANMNVAAKLVLSKADGLLEPMRDVADACRAEQESLSLELCRLAGELWPERLRLLRSITGVGEKSAAVMLVCCKGMEGFSSHRKLSSFIGLAPSVKESGTSVKGRGRIKKTGNSYLRALLYMCAHSAQRFNKPCMEYYERLRAKGKAKDLATVAVMHKLVKIAFAVVQSGEPFRGGKKATA